MKQDIIIQQRLLLTSKVQTKLYQNTFQCVTYVLTNKTGDIVQKITFLLFRNKHGIISSVFLGRIRKGRMRKEKDEPVDNGYFDGRGSAAAFLDREKRLLIKENYDFL